MGKNKKFKVNVLKEFNTFQKLKAVKEYAKFASENELSMDYLQTFIEFEKYLNSKSYPHSMY